MKHVLITAGGTGGHVFPALAVAEVLKDAGWRVSWLGTSDRIEAKVVPEAGYDFSGVEQNALRGKGILGWLIAPFRLTSAVIKMRRFLALKKPDVVLGFGGYTAGPVGLAAKLKGIPLVIHEQNAVAGMTNKLLAPLSKRVLLGFSSARAQLKKGEWVGNPVREAITNLGFTDVPLATTKLNVLVVGGSLGAQHLNHVLPQALCDWKGMDIDICHQTGKNKHEEVTERYQAMESGKVKAHVVEFIDDMKTAYVNAQLVICRAGALTCSELACVGRASVLVPYPYAVDNHQFKNAQELAKVGSAQVIEQKQFTVEHVREVLETLAAQPSLLKEMGEKARAVSEPEAAKKVAEVCAQVVGTTLIMEHS